MQYERSLCIHEKKEGPGKGDDGVRAIYSSEDEKHRPLEGEVKMLVEGCRRMGADASIVEYPDRAIVAAVNVYDGTYALAICDLGASLPSIARDLQVQLCRQACDARPTEFLYATIVRTALGRWERQIAVVFGRRFASKLVASAVGPLEQGKMTREDLEQVRLCLSAAVGGCITFLSADKMLCQDR